MVDVVMGVVSGSIAAADEVGSERREGVSKVLFSWWFVRPGRGECGGVVGRVAFR